MKYLILFFIIFSLNDNNLRYDQPELKSDDSKPNEAQQNTCKKCTCDSECSGTLDSTFDWCTTKNRCGNTLARSLGFKTYDYCVYPEWGNFEKLDRESKQN